MPRGAKPGERRGGRAKGTPNKFTRDIKEAILTALNNAGGPGGAIAYLEEQAKANPSAFMTLVGKTLPTTLSGEVGKPIQIVLTKDDSKL